MKKGVALIWAVILCAVLMLIATIITTAVIKESQFSVRIDSSVRAYSAASSGIEWGKYCIESEAEKNAGNPSPPDPAAACLNDIKTFNINSTPNNVKYNVVITGASPRYVIKSTGEVGTDVKRTLEYVYSAVPLTGILNGNLGSVSNLGLSGSFLLSYDFWVVPSSQSEFGVQNTASGSQRITVLYTPYDVGNERTLRLKVTDGTKTVISVPIILNNNLLKDGITDSYRVKLEIRYIDKNTVTLTIKRRYNPSFELEYCTNRVSVDLTKITDPEMMATFNYFYLGGIGYSTAADPLGDGDVTELMLNGTAVAYLDNIMTTSSNYAN